MTRPLAGQPEPLQARSAGAEAFTQALRYALAVTEPVTAELMPTPTPCRGWDLWMLLTHAAESLSALAEGFDQGCVSRHSSWRPSEGCGGSRGGVPAAGTQLARFANRP